MLDKNSEEYWNSLLESEGLGDIDNEEKIDFIKNTSDNINNILDENIEGNIDLLIGKIENEKNIKININIDSKEISLFTLDGDLIGKIWYDGYDLGDGIIDPNHLGIEVYGEYQGKGFSNILYNLYKKVSEDNEDFIYPDYDLAEKNSRINLLLNQGYRLEEVYINGYFHKLDDDEKQKIYDDIEKNYYDKQKYTFKLVLEE